jgi:hypothetical protein
MNYENYERVIVERHSLALVGWPEGKVRNPGSIVGGQGTINQLFSALKNRDCHWVKLTDEELQARITANEEAEARGEQVYKRRKKQQSAKSTEFVVSDNDNTED